MSNDNNLLKEEVFEVSAEEVTDWDESRGEPEVEPTDLSVNNLEQKYAESQLQIVRTSMDFPLQTLQHSLQDPGYINLAPIYQRRLRWDRKRRSQLIESFLMNIPVPPIFLFESSYNRYEVMDGRQRLETIHDFLENKFDLTGLEFWSELKGKRYSDLNPTLQRGLLRRSIQAIVLLAETTKPTDKIDVRMILFRRLNTGGAQLNPQEMRNALYPGKFNEMLEELARTKSFTTIWRIPPKTPEEQEKPPAELLKNSLYKSMADCELVLRFFAIKETIEDNLKGAIKSILDNCMARHKYDDEPMIKRHTRLFNKCLEILYGVFDAQPFILPKLNRPSRPLYDALMVACSLNMDFDYKSNKILINQRLEDALNNSEKYEVLVGRGNTIEAIRNRVLEANDILFGKGN